LRVFLDTNIIVSAFATRGLCADFFREILSAHTLITSEHILEETEDVLARRFKVPKETVGEIIELLRKQEIVTPSDTPPQISIRDLDDLPVVAAAIEAKADYLVSGDKDRLSLVPLNELKIATPREFWTVIFKIYPI
jgi:putative PIN family toxin of toxin-antitoxin system